MPGYNSTVENITLAAGNVVVLARGVGGAKLANGFAQDFPPERLTCIVDTGEGFCHMGYGVCPDVYPLRNVDPVRATVAAIPELVFTISPIIGGAAVTGLAAKMMAQRDLPVSAQGGAGEQRTTKTLTRTRQDRADSARTIIDYTMELVHA